jgi:hypothetical protein
MGFAQGEPVLPQARCLAAYGRNRPRKPAVATPFAGPKGKAPWIEIDGNKMGDSTFIIAYLTQRYGIDPDADLTTEQRGIAVAIQRLIDDNLYWTMVRDH